MLQNILAKRQYVQLLQASICRAAQHLSTSTFSAKELKPARKDSKITKVETAIDNVFKFSPDFEYRRKKLAYSTKTRANPVRDRVPIKKMKKIIELKRVKQRVIVDNAKAQRLIEIDISASPAAAAFGKLGIPPQVCQLFVSRGYEHPTEIQQLAIPILLKGTSAIMSSHTGSGKTLAFLLPLLMRMKANEERRRTSPERLPQGPRVVLLSPTRELSDQLYKETKELSHLLKFRSRHWANKKVKYVDVYVPDVVVASPTAFVRDMHYLYDTIESIVIDECDAMLFANSGFVDDLNTIAKKVAQSNVQWVGVGATSLTGDAMRWLNVVNNHSPPVTVIDANRKNTLLPQTIKLDFEKVQNNEGYDKHFALDRALANFLSRPLPERPEHTRRCLVFCNSIEGCRAIQHSLNMRYGETCSFYSLHGDMRPQRRQENFQQFTDESVVNRHRVMVCTDMASRGVDIQNVDLVVIFDRPSKLPDFVHRAGRTGRAGKDGKVIFIVGRGEKEDIEKLLSGVL